LDAAALSIEDSYRQCEQLARRSASNFYWAFWLLDREQRRSMYALYAFSRRTDDVVDGPVPLALAPTSVAAVESLAGWREAWHAALAGEYRDPLLPAVVDTVRRRGIPPRYLEAILDGVARDLRPEPFATRVELTEYCEKVASAVGICCLHIWTGRPEPAYDAARECGLAFQLTNILRDLREDAVRGRLYLPCDELAAHQLSPACVQATLQQATPQQAAVRNATLQQATLRNAADPPCEEALVAVLRRQIAIAAAHYEAGWETRRFLVGGPGRAFAMMFNTYRELLARIADDPRQLLVQGPRLGTACKLWLAARACFGSAPHAQFRPIATTATP
jgi:phytoene synthase